jgi:hypothetical protein
MVAVHSIESIKRITKAGSRHRISHDIIPARKPSGNLHSTRCEGVLRCNG